MLILTRQIHEEIVICDQITITVLETQPGRVRLGVTAPASISVDRAEVHARKCKERASRPVAPHRAAAQPVQSD
jgi:carbon storage regulator CsrA